MTADLTRLSLDHPLRNDPARPWPYAVVIGYRARGKRSIVARHTLHVRATSPERAKCAAMREALGGVPWIKDGVRLKASRPLSVRPLDRGDRIGREPSHDNRPLHRQPRKIGGAHV